MDGVKLVLYDTANKFKLFMRHQIRFYVHHTVFYEATCMVMNATPQNIAIVVIYYKMKYEHHKIRQKSDWYGRKGMSWHGSVVIFLLPVGEEDKQPENDVVKLKNLYLDHICKKDSNQTEFPVFSILELVCRQICLSVPSLRYVII